MSYSITYRCDWCGVEAGAGDCSLPINWGLHGGEDLCATCYKAVCVTAGRVKELAQLPGWAERARRMTIGIWNPETRESEHRVPLMGEE